MRRQIQITPEDLHAGGEAVSRRVEMLGGAEVEFRTPRMAPERHLVGRTVETDVIEETDLQVVVEQSRQYLNVTLRGETIPSMLWGRVMDDGRGPASAVLAIAVNGRIETTTKTYDTVPGHEGGWAALVDPRVFRQGRNAVDIFIVRETRLTRAFSTTPPALASINLISHEARSAWEAEVSGFHPLEGDARHRFRWSSGPARIEMTLPGDERPRSLRLGLAPIARRSPLRVVYNGCVAFDGTVPGGPWHATVALDRCAESARSSERARIEIESPTFVVPRGDPRTLGLPFETVRLSVEPWPLPDTTVAARARLRIVEPDVAKTGLAAGTPVLVEIGNLGSSALASAAEAETPRPVRLVASWRLPADGKPPAQHAVDLPRVLYPGERTQLWLRLDPPPAIQQSRAMSADVSLELVQAGEVIVLAAPAAPHLNVKLR
jgi:hypothetical protein